MTTPVDELMTTNPDKPIENKDRTPEALPLVLGQLRMALNEIHRLTFKDPDNRDKWLRCARHLHALIVDVAE